MSDDLQLARDLFDLERRISEKLAELKSDTLELNKAAYKGITDLTARLAPLEADLVERKAAQEQAEAEAAKRAAATKDAEIAALRDEISRLNGIVQAVHSDQTINAIKTRK